MVSRTLKPELLDTLPPGDSDAIHSRRDLRCFNRAMGNPAWFRDTLPRLMRPGDRILELGAGTGELRRSVLPRECHWDALDLAPRPPDWPRGSLWFQTDARAFDGWTSYNVVVANLFFHHLEDADLKLLGARMRNSVRMILCAEPARARRWQWLFRAVCLMVRANRVSRHDGHVSIAAGFRGDELAAVFGLDPLHWNSHASTTPRGVYRLVATRRSDHS